MNDTIRMHNPPHPGETLRDDITHWSGWWKNRVARTLLNFFLVCIGTIIGEYTAGIHIFKSLF